MLDHDDPPLPTIDPDRYAMIAETLEAEIANVIVGQHDLVRDALCCLLAEGHLLIEGVPGLGKTQLVLALSSVVGLDSGRIQFTPDLMPADIVGTQVLESDSYGSRRFRFPPAPSSRTCSSPTRSTEPPRRRSRRCSRRCRSGVSPQVARTSDCHAPSSCWRRRTPSTMEGTYPLPEAQLDRFMLKSRVGMPTSDELVSIIERTTGAVVPTCSQVAEASEVLAMIELTRSVPVPSHVVRYAADLVLATHPGGGASDLIDRYVRFGASPRGAQALLLGAKVTALRDGRPSVAIDDVRAVAHAALRHRIGLGYEAAVDDVDGDRLVSALLESVETASAEV